MASMLRNLEQAGSADAMLAEVERLAAWYWARASGLLLRDRLYQLVKGAAGGLARVETIRGEEPA